MRLLKALFVGPYVPIRRPTFDPSESLYQRQIKAAAKCPVNGIKPLLLEDQPTTFIQPAAVPEERFW